MSRQRQEPNLITVQANSCCANFLENQIRFMEAVRKTLEEFDRETVINQIDQLLNYYKKKFAELPK